MVAVTTGFPDFEAGNDLSVTLYFVDDNGNPVDVTGATLYFTLKSTPYVADAGASIMTTYSPAGTSYVMTLTAAQTTGVVPGYYFGELRIKTATSKVYTLIYQAIQVIAPILETVP